MLLVDLEPKWLLDMTTGQRVGFIFRCPTKKQCWQSCFVDAPINKIQWRLFALAFGQVYGEFDFDDIRHDVQGCTTGSHWDIWSPPDVQSNAIERADFATLSCSPSLDGAAGGNWHGHITDGKIVGGGIQPHGE